MLHIAKFPSTEFETILHSTSNIWVPLCLQPYQQNVFKLLNFCQLDTVKCYLCVISISISLKSENFFNVSGPLYLWAICLCLLKKQTFNNKNLPISELRIKWSLALEDLGSSLNSPSYCGTLGQMLNMSSTFLIYKMEHSYRSPIRLMGIFPSNCEVFPNFFCHVRLQREVCNPEEGPHSIMHVPWLSTSRTMKNKFLLFKAKKQTNTKPSSPILKWKNYLFTLILPLDTVLFPFPS